jgi:hypothetical protein
MNTHASEVRDLDHVVMTEGRICRVVGNLDHPAVRRLQPLRSDALDTYVMLPKARICEHLDPAWSRASASRAGARPATNWTSPTSVA